MPREPKSRRIEREYFADREFMTLYSAEEREFYIGLSMYADDAGWLDWDPAELAAGLYRYEAPDARESKVSAMAGHLQSTGRLKLYRCGHALLPRVAKRPRGMAREYAVQDAHSVHSKSTRSALSVHSPPNLTEPNLSSPDLPKTQIPAITRAPVRGAGSADNGTPKSLREIIGPPESMGIPVAAKKS